MIFLSNFKHFWLEFSKSVSTRKMILSLSHPMSCALFVSIDHLAAHSQPESWSMTKFLRFTPRAPEEEKEDDGDSIKLSGRASLCL